VTKAPVNKAVFGKTGRQTCIAAVSIGFKGYTYAKTRIFYLKLQ